MKLSKKSSLRWDCWRVKKQGFSLAIIFALILSSQSIVAAKSVWRPIGKGISYAAIKVEPGTIHAVKVDPRIYKLGIVTAKQIGEESASVKTMAEKKKALVAINGGFFSPEHRSLGLLIDNGKELNPLKGTSWWSVFFIKNNRPYIKHTKSFKKSSAITMAIQSGPRLVVNGSVTKKLKPSLAERSAICINRRNEVALIATENLLIRPDVFAAYLKESETSGGLGCRSALNLDGGRSTQFYAKVGSLKLNVPGVNKVANAVVVLPR